jgi:hypothetical protein
MTAGFMFINGWLDRFPEDCTGKISGIIRRRLLNECDKVSKQ